MFDKLRSAIKTLSKAITERTLDEKEVSKLLWEFEIALMESDVAYEVVEQLISKVKSDIVGTRIQRSVNSSEYLGERLTSAVKEIFSGAKPLNVLEMIKEKKAIGEPFIIVFLGVNGTGKCVRADTSIPLADGRLMMAKELYNHALEKSKEEPIEGGYFVNTILPDVEVYAVNLQSMRIEKVKPTGYWKLQPTEHLLKVELDNGLQVSVTPEHPFFILNERGEIAKVPARDLAKDTYIMVPRKLPEVSGKYRYVEHAIAKLSKDPKFFVGPSCFASQVYSFILKRHGKLDDAWKAYSIDRSYVSFAYMWREKGFIPAYLVDRVIKQGYRVTGSFLIKYGKGEPITFPQLQPLLMSFLGLSYSDGRVDRQQVCFYNTNPKLIKDFVHISKKLFGNINYDIIRDKKRENLRIVRIHSKTLVRFLELVMEFPEKKKSQTMKVPEQVCQTSAGYQRNFLRRYFDGDMGIAKNERMAEIVTASKSAAQALSVLLLRQDIAPSVGHKFKSGREYSRIYITGRRKFEQLHKLAYPSSKSFAISQSKMIPYQFEESELIPNLGQRLKSLRKKLGYGQCQIAQLTASSRSLISLYESNSVKIPREKILLLVKGLRSKAKSKEAKEEAQYMRKLATADVFWVKVKRVSSINPEGFVYDLTVPKHHNFIANNIVVHNTTTIAKFANLLKKSGFSVILACSDTHRAGAIEQLTEHAERLSVKVISQKYGSDPAAVARDAVLHAKSKKIDAVLIDTAGRMQTSRNLMEEMSKITRVVNPDLKIFVGDALAGNDAVSQAKEFQEFTNFDAAILTKVDADVKGGAALSITYVTGKPIIYLGTGQRYDDLTQFNADSFTSSLFEEK